MAGAPPLALIPPTAAPSAPAPAPAPAPQSTTQTASYTPPPSTYTGGAMSPQQAAQLAMSVGFSGPGLVDIVAIMGRESGYDPTAQNPSSGALGLTQINWSTWPNLVPLMQSLGYNVSDTNQAVALLTDPTVNLRVAYSVSNGGTDFSDWNLTTPGTYLDSTDVPTAQAVVQQITGQVYQPTTQGTMGNSMASAAQAGANGVQFSGARGDALQLSSTGGSSGSGNAGSFDAGTASAQLQSLQSQLEAAIKANPQLAVNLGAIISSLATTIQGLNSVANNVWTDPNTGQTVPFSSLPPSEQAAINSANADAYNNLMNQFGLSQWNITSGAQASGNAALSTQFQNQIASYSQQIALGNMTLQQANDALQRWMDSQTVAQNTEQDIQNAQTQAEQWGTSNGQSAFTPADMGSSFTRLAQQAGVNPNAVTLQYPGVQTMNPLGELVSSVGLQGQSIAPPAIPNVTAGIGAPPGAPALNTTFTPPQLTPPPPFTGSGTGASLAPPVGTTGSNVNSGAVPPPTSGNYSLGFSTTLPQGPIQSTTKDTNANGQPITWPTHASGTGLRLAPPLRRGY